MTAQQQNRKILSGKLLCMIRDARKNDAYRIYVFALYHTNLKLSIPCTKFIVILIKILLKFTKISI